MCRLRNIAMCDYQESVITRQTHGQTDTGQSDPYVPLCFTGDTKCSHDVSMLSDDDTSSSIFTLNLY